MAYVSYGRNKSQQGYIGDYQGLLRGILGVQTMAHIDSVKGI